MLLSEQTEVIVLLVAIQSKTKNKVISAKIIIEKRNISYIAVLPNFVRTSICRGVINC